ncbi:MAG: deoxyguanosinetriphosphate triphosphohydrolase [Clostridia bacterium]|nr:deoxyguanosinetriphosphate triphosphohydrolase [Clostridia bacterium]
MEIRRGIENRERETLSPFAALSCRSAGRCRPEEECDLRTCFQRDRDRIIHCGAFRRLKHKTQVFLSPEGDHYRTRLTHTLEVSQIARTVARALRLNEDLTEAIALGHDLGHTPFGHAGERKLNELSPSGFAHNTQSLRVVDRLEKDGRGLNLTAEVRDGIVCHTGSRRAATLEGRIVALADRIAYMNHDIDDAIRAGILTEGDIPAALRTALGESKTARINTLVRDCIAASADTNDIGLSEEIGQASDELHAFMFRCVYTNPIAKGEEGKAQEIIAYFYRVLAAGTEPLPADYREIAGTDGTERAICDYIASMTDNYCIREYTRLAIPESWQVL